MVHTEEALARLTAIPHLLVSTGAALSTRTRFGIGGPADVYAETGDLDAFLCALRAARQSGWNFVVIGGGTNLIVADHGFRGIVLRYTADRITANGSRVIAAAGAILQTLVDVTIGLGLQGLDTMTGIPGSVGGAVYGNAGAYGRSIDASLVRVTYFDGEAVRELSAIECEFHYRESIFKRRKDWYILSAELELAAADSALLRQAADEILTVRNAKYPPSMKCAGSIFKNLLLRDLPEEAGAALPRTVIREGKVPSAYFLEQVGAKGMKQGDIHVADYHANLICNAGAGTAADLRMLIDELKERVRSRFGIRLEEEVQYVGW